MSTSTFRRISVSSLIGGLGLLGGLSFGGLWPLGAVWAQAPVQPGRSIDGFVPLHNQVQERVPRPRLGESGIDEMVEISNVDGRFDVIVGQSRLVHLRRGFLDSPPAEGTRRTAHVAVGHPGVVELEILNTRLLRLVGRRIGTTDLVLVSPSGETLVFEVNVVYDLDTLRHQLAPSSQGSQPRGSQPRLRAMQHNIVAGGEVRSFIEAGQTLEQLPDYIRDLRAVQQAQITSSSSGQAPPPAAAPANNDK
jgi:hypothetical protein